jgi:hypothetical protein
MDTLGGSVTQSQHRVKIVITQALVTKMWNAPSSGTLDA